ncbi:MAG: flagellar biosynthesis protein FliQ [Phycisphaerales bacterium]|nr:flagellar biosynthesis protein FliQ [Phycisphaerales bacterium]
MYYDDNIIDLVREMLIITLKIAGPILLAGIVVGLAISLFQSITSIQEQTLTFVPKIVAMLIVAVVLLPWIIQRLVEFTVAMFSGF